MISLKPPPTVRTRAGRPSPTNSRWIGVARVHRGRESGDSLAARPGRAGVHEPPSDTTLLELVCDGDRHLGRLGAIRLDAQVADYSLEACRTVVDDRHEALPVVMIGRAEGRGLSVAEFRADR